MSLKEKATDFVMAAFEWKSTKLTDESSRCQLYIITRTSFSLHRHCNDTFQYGIESDEKIYGSFCLGKHKLIGESPRCQLYFITRASIFQFAQTLQRDSKSYKSVDDVTDTVQTNRISTWQNFLTLWTFQVYQHTT